MNATTVSICTPTFNRRPFIPFLVETVKAQTYNHALIEWIICDDGTDSIEDIDIQALIPTIRVVYHRISTGKITIGAKRNLMNSLATGAIIVNMDDDDYYPPTRVDHAVRELMQNQLYWIAGSPTMHIWFSAPTNQMWVYGPPSVPWRSTAATFAYRRELTLTNKYAETAISEEAAFTQNWTTPMIILDPLQTILVFAHDQNSINKYDMINGTNPLMKRCDLLPGAFISAQLPHIYDFYTKNINATLSTYTDGHVKHKPDIIGAIQTAKDKHANKIVTLTPKSELAPRFTSLAEMQLYYESIINQKTLLIGGLLEKLKQSAKNDTLLCSQCRGTIQPTTNVKSIL